MPVIDLQIDALLIKHWFRSCNFWVKDEIITLVFVLEFYFKLSVESSA